MLQHYLKKKLTNTKYILKYHFWNLHDVIRDMQQPMFVKYRCNFCQVLDYMSFFCDIMNIFSSGIKSPTFSHGQLDVLSQRHLNNPIYGSGESGKF
jgi:hypothetical protein